MARASRQISLPYIKIDRGSDMPLYEQLYEGIRGAILAGVLKAGDRLPATRLIGEELRFTDPAAGMHLAAWFKRPVDEVTLLGAAREMGLVVPSLRDYTIGDYERPGILLGYAAFSEEKIKQAVKGLAACFSKIS